ncbi:30S ribosomal protein S6 [Corynebacterium sp. HMSC076D02]|nr:30S ribosomal protein S6 [Corynebacterium sp. HMSC076D02]
MRSVRHYEVMIILDPNQDERTVSPSLDKFLEVIRKDGGKVENVDVWGKRRLAYAINKKEEGIYAVVTLECESASVLELDRRLNLNDTILRTKVLRTDSK